MAWDAFPEAVNTVIAANWQQSITKEITAAASARHHTDTDIPAAKKTLAHAEAVGVASEGTLANASRANQEATLAVTAARESLQAARAENLPRPWMVTSRTLHLSIFTFIVGRKALEPYISLNSLFVRY